MATAISVGTTQQPAVAAAERAAILFPFNGNTWLAGDGPGAHHHFWNAWSIDLHAPVGTAVKARFISGDGDITLSVASVGATCAAPNSAGSNVTVNVYVDGTHVGEVIYGHLNNVQVSAGQTIGVNTTLGYLKNWAFTSCWQDGTDDGVVHTHIEVEKGCYRGLPAWTGYSEGTPVGLLKSAYASSNVSTCDENEVSQVVLGGGTEGGGSHLRSDLTRDGRDDIAWFRNGTVWGLESTGTSFRSSAIASGYGQPTWAGVGDFNGDGRSDIAWYQAHNRTLYLLKANSDGVWAAGPVMVNVDAPAWAGVADVTKDGKDDIIWYQTQSGGQLTALVANTAGTSFYRSGLVSGLEAPLWAGTGDFNGDGRGDVAWYLERNHTLYLVKANSGGRWAVGPVMVNLAPPDWAGTGDLTRDGMDDIAWYEADNNGGTITALMSNQSTFIPSAVANGFAQPAWAGVGDFDGDDRSDIAWYHDSNRTLYLLKANSDGVWAAGPVMTNLAPSSWAHAAG